MGVLFPIKRRLQISLICFFCNIGPNVVNNIGNIEHGSFKKYLNNPCSDVLNFKPVEEADVIKIIDNLSSKNSCGIDKITTKLLKTITPYITKSIAFIINQSLASGVFPDKLKIAKIVPIFKKNDPTLLDNYRPISLLPVFSKIFERVIFDQLHNHFNLHNLYFESQYGFRKKHSTESAVLELVDKTIKHMDSGDVPISIFLDLSKAFDTLDHDILLDKLSYYGVKETEIPIEIPIININNVNIECVANFDFLGVTIDKKLSWNGHTDKISLKLSRCVGILNKLKRFLPQHILLTIYNSMFLPHINYCILAWGYNHQRIFKIQKKVVRIISLSKYNAHTDPLFKHLKLLKMKDIHQIQQLKFYHKLINNQTPKNFTSLDLVFNFENHEHNTRRRNYITHRVRREYANLCVRNSLPYLLNNTDQIILSKTTTHSLHDFAIYIKNSILNTYKDECNIDNCYICLDRPL